MTTRRLAHLRSREAVARADDERGAVLIELAMVSIVLMVLLAGAFDFGMAWRSGLATMEAARTGARTGSGLKSSVNADYDLLASTRAALECSGLRDEVTMVAIFRSDSVDGTVPAGCKPGGSGTCNVLTGAQLRGLASTPTGNINATGCVTNSVRRAWCPTTRNDVQLDADYLGVWVRVDHGSMFGFTQATFPIERTSIMRLEPRED